MGKVDVHIFKRVEHGFFALKAARVAAGVQASGIQPKAAAEDIARRAKAARRRAAEEERQADQ